MDKAAVKKIKTMSFMCAAVLAYITVGTVFKVLAGSFGIVQKWYSIDVLNHGLPIVAASVLFLVLQFNEKIIVWSEEVIVEVSKVIWPSRTDTIGMTFYVCVFCSIAGVLLVVIDFLAHNFVQMIVQQ
jgi:preprotein translocase SecE subunit